MEKRRLYREEEDWRKDYGCKREENLYSCVFFCRVGVPWASKVCEAFRAVCRLGALNLDICFCLVWFYTDLSDKCTQLNAQHYGKLRHCNSSCHVVTVELSKGIVASLYRLPSAF